MTESYNWTDNPTLSGVAECNTDVLNDCLMHLKYSQQNANTNLSNLSATGEKHFLGKSQITNCLLEVPQNIKLELADGVLTLKAGSKVIVPNGAGVFDEITTTKDLSIKLSGSYDPQTKYIVVKANGAALTTHNSMDSGTSTTTGSWTIYYNTETGLIGQTGNYSEIDYTTKLSFPIAITTYDGVSAFTSIDQVFNGFGYIGSTVWVNKGVKCLIPNGRNEDGTLKGVEFTTSKVLTFTRTSKYDNFTLILKENELASTIASFDEESNFNKNSSGGNINYCIVGSVSSSDNKGQISFFNVKQPFRAVDYNEFAKVQNSTLGRPDYSSITAFSAYGDYTPTYDCLFISYRSGNSNDAKLEIKVGDTILFTNVTGNYPGHADKITFILTKGTTFNITKTGNYVSYIVPLK